MAILGSSSCSESSDDDEVLVSVPRFAHGHHRHGSHHHHHHHGHGHHSHHGHHHERVGDGRGVSKFSRRKNPVLRRLAHRSGRSKQEKLFRSLLRRQRDPDQQEASHCEDIEVEGRDDFPFHVLEHRQARVRTKSTAFFNYMERVHIEQVLRRISERGWARPLGAEALVEERSAARSLPQLPLTRRHGRRRKHHRHHRRPRHRQHHRDCPCQSYELGTGSYELCLRHRVTERRANRFGTGPEAQAAASDSQIRDEVGPLSAYEEMLAQCLLDIPQAGPSATYEEKMAERLLADNEAGPSATYEEKLAERLMDNPEAEVSADMLG